MWPFKDGTPIYLQITEEMKLRILRGVYPAGAQVPPVRELAMEAGVNPNTVQRAYTQMEAEGILKSDRTRGRFVTEDKRVLKELKDSLSSGFVREMISKMKDLGMNEDEIVSAVQKEIKEDGK